MQKYKKAQYALYPIHCLLFILIVLLLFSPSFSLLLILYLSYVYCVCACTHLCIYACIGIHTYGCIHIHQVHIHVYNSWRCNASLTTNTLVCISGEKGTFLHEHWDKINIGALIKLWLYYLTSRAHSKFVNYPDNIFHT